MKRTFLQYFLIILSVTASSVCAQTRTVETPIKKVSAAPVSHVINAEQMLRDVETLSADDMQGRRIGTEGGIKAREYVVTRFKNSGLKSFGTSYLQPFDFTNRAGAKISGANVVGYIEGKKNKDKYIVVSAHYDHVGVRNGEIYNGADDDASGTAALFAIAEYFKKNPPEHSIIFAAFDGEESGLRGAAKFVAEPPVAQTAIRLNVNMDMVSRSDKSELYAAGTFHHPFLTAPLEKIAVTAKIKLLLGHDRPELKSGDWTFQSDHGAFHQAKIPFVYFGVEDHKDYHKPTDDYANINQEFYVRAVETILEVVKSFDKDLK